MIKKIGADNIFMLLNQVSIFCFSLILISSINYRYIFIIAILASVTILLPKLMDKQLNLAAKQVSRSNRVFLQGIDSWLGGLREILIFNTFNLLKTKLSKVSYKLENANVHNKKVMNLSWFLNGLANSISQFTLMAFGGYFFFSKLISLGEWAAANDFAFAIFSSLLTLTNLVNQISSVRSVKDEVNKYLLNKEQTNPIVKKQNIVSTPVSFKIHNLKFNYDNNELKYPDIEVQKGEKILLIGPSGIGKTTLFKLILGELRPKTGSINFFDNQNTQINPDYQKIGYIPQKAIIFPDTVAHNITMFNSSLNSDLNKISQNLNLDLDLKMQLKAGGANISGGQKQKIILARSQIHDSSIVLMDEATSAIDQKTLPEILKQLVEGNQTLIMIEHNISEDLKRYFDRVIELR